ncbi:hypothetical protein DFJ74DRAFT_643350 [Hyaloraphidium curvatum]|nr:hypothetical protein DFJ74DRAFT_643350 [Hyaloraphidium curvatum]
MPFYTTIQPIRKKLTARRVGRGQASIAYFYNIAVDPHLRRPIRPPCSRLQLAPVQRPQKRIVNQTCEEHERVLEERILDQRVPRAVKDRVIEFTVCECGTPPQEFVQEVMHFCQRWFPNVPFVPKDEFEIIRPKKVLSLGRPPTQIPLTEWEADDLFDGLDAVSDTFPPHVWSVIVFTKSLISGDALDDSEEGEPRIDFSYFTSSWTDTTCAKSFPVNGCNKRYLGMISTAPFGDLDGDATGAVLRRTLRSTVALIMHQFAIEECVTFACIKNRPEHNDSKSDGVLFPCPICLLKLAACCFSRPEDCLKWFEGIESYIQDLVDRGLSAFAGDLEWYRASAGYIREKQSAAELKHLMENLGRRKRGARSQRVELECEESDEDWSVRLRRKGRNGGSASKFPRLALRQTSPEAPSASANDAPPEGEVTGMQRIGRVPSVSNRSSSDSDNEDDEDYVQRTPTRRPRRASPAAVPETTTLEDHMDPADSSNVEPDAHAGQFAEAAAEPDVNGVRNESSFTFPPSSVSSVQDPSPRDNPDPARPVARPGFLRQVGSAFGSFLSSLVSFRKRSEPEVEQAADDQSVETVEKGGTAPPVAPAAPDPAPDAACEQIAALSPPSGVPDVERVGIKFSVACQALLKSAAAARTSTMRLSRDSEESCDAFLERVCPRLVKGFPDRRFFLSTADPIVADAHEGFRFEGRDTIGEVIDELPAGAKTLFICCESREETD